MMRRQRTGKNITKVGIRVNLIAVPESGERKRNLTTPGLGENKAAK